jgi:hypothetical protein
MPDLQTLKDSAVFTPVIRQKSLSLIGGFTA